MKVENTYYVIMKIGNINIDEETQFLHGDDFVNNIMEADKCVNRKAAFAVKYEYDRNQNNCHESDLKIIPVRETYEW